MPLPTLITKHLKLVPLTHADADTVVEMFADPAMSTYMSIDFSVEANGRAMVERRLAHSDDKLGHWTVTEKGETVGLVHLRPSFELPASLIEIGWYTATSRAGRGLAQEAAAALLRYGQGLGLPAIWAVVDPRNAASLAVAHKLGFLHVGEGHHYGALHDVMVLLNERR